MRLDVFFTPGEAAGTTLAGRSVVVIDVLRATSTIIEALANGARAVLPTDSIEEAVRLGQSVGDGDALRCGERGGERIDGFDLGNSPREFVESTVRDRLLVMTTTNGTGALLAATGAERVLVGSLMNLNAVTDALLEAGSPIALLCAGRDARFALEDALCAGAIVGRLLPKDSGFEPNDAAAVAAELPGRISARAMEPRLRRTAAGRALIEIGLGDDITVCADVDRHEVVPRLRDRTIVL